MATDRLSGKLAVILHADVVGSTLLVQQDEQLAHQRIQLAFRRFGEVITDYRGRVQELRGDALLAEFERASDAVSASLAFLASHEAVLDQYEDQIKPAVRVGIALGEVVIADATVTGAGVVLAQRIEQIAGPGQVCITAAIHEATPQRMPFAIENLGDQPLKGFDDPVRVYRVSMAAGVDLPPPPDKPAGPVATTLGKPWLAVLGAVLLIAIGLVFALRGGGPVEEPASMERMAFPLPDKPSVAVLPFNNISGDPEQEYFADGITENLITDLSQVSGLFVIARNSSFSYKGKQLKIRQVAEELGVRYVMEGSVQRAGNQVRINAQLIDATTGGHLWAERYDGTLTDVFALQDQVTEQIVDAMAVTLTADERGGLATLGTTNVAAHDAYLQGLSYYYRSTPADNARAEPYFKQAIELDPGFARAYTALAKVYYKGREWEYSQALVTWWRKAVFKAHRLLVRGNGERIADVHVVRAQMALHKHQLAIAREEADRALALDSNNVEALKVKAAMLIYSGDYAAGRGLAEQVKRLDPVAIAESLYLIGLSYFATEDYARAVEYIERAIQHDPMTARYLRLLAAAHGKQGDTSRANRAWRQYRKSWRRNEGQFWIAAAVQFYPFQQDRVLLHLAEGFRAAGGVERPPSLYLKLTPENRLSGEEIEALLFGRRVRGEDYWLGDFWQQQRSLDGRGRHVGANTFSATEDEGVESGESWVEGDRLCDRWSEADGGFTICVLIFRDPDRGPDHYYMVTDTGPHPFTVVE